MLILGVPLVGSHLAQFAINLTDTLMLGWYNVEALAASVLGGTMFFTLFIVGSGFAQAVLPMVAKAASEGDEVQIRRVTRMGLWLALLFAVLVLPVMWFSAPVLLFLGQEPEVAALSQTYLRIAGWGVAPALVIMVLKSYLAAQDRAQIVLWVTVLGAIGNGLANWALIFGNWGFPEMGIQGAAIASLFNNLLTLGAVCLYCAFALPQQAIFTRIWRPDWEAFRVVFRLGWPIGVTNFAEVGLFAASSLMMGWLGVLPLAAHGIALQLASAIFMVHLGLSQAATIRAGKALGQKDARGLIRGGVTGLVLSLSVVFFTVILFLGWPGPLMSLFLSSDDPNRAEILRLGAGLLAMAALFQLADAAQVMALGVLRGVQDTHVPMILAVITYWVIGVPTAYLFGFPLGWGGPGIWLGLAVGLSLAAVTMHYRFWVTRTWSKLL